MSFSRRAFLRLGATCALGIGLPLQLANHAFGQQRAAGQPPPSGLAEIPYESQLDPVFHFTSQTFRPYLTTTFRLQGGSDGRAFNAQLVEVTDVGSRLVKVRGRGRDEVRVMRAAQGEVCFSLIFAGARNEAARQGIYRVEHDALGSFELFLVPVGRPGGQLTHYEAIINRMAPSP